MYRFVYSTAEDFSLADLRIALYTYISAKQSEKKFIIRIADTKKQKDDAPKDIQTLDILSLFGLHYDYLYYQSENFKYHLQFASSLMDKGKAYACFCKEKELKNDKCDGRCTQISQEELLNNNLPFTIRLKDKQNNFIIMSQEKYPTFDFANACDDMLQGVSHVFTSQNEIQDHIRKSLGYEETIQCTYLPCSSSLKKISVKSLLDAGYFPESIISCILFQDTKSTHKSISLDEAIEDFSLNQISNVAMDLDMDLLRAINIEQIKKLDDMEISKRIAYSCTSIGQLAKLYTQEVSTTLEIKEKIDKIFSKKEHKKMDGSLNILKKHIQTMPYFESFEEFSTYLMSKSALSEEAFSPALRFLLTGTQDGPSLESIYPFIKNYLKEIARW